LTTPIAHEVERRRGPRRRPRSFAESLAARLRAGTASTVGAAGDGETIAWPSPRWREDPLAFFRNVLGVEPWSRQEEIIDLAKNHRRVAVASGNKIGKSVTAVGLALWFYSSYEDARVIFSSTTSRQVDAILWRELRMVLYRSGRCVDCKRKDPLGTSIPRPCPHSAIIDGHVNDLARSGMRSNNFREIVGFTAREAEAVAGISGKNLFYIVDEASGVPDLIFEAIEGNRAGGARIIMFSNPTRNEGEFFEAFHTKADFYKTLSISSEENPNYQSRREIIPGLATHEWIEEKRQEWGEDNPWWKVRVLGQFATSEERKILSIHAIRQAEERWPDASDKGRLFIGLDPSGPGGLGDESVFCVRRNLKVLQLYAMRGLTEDAHLQHLLGILSVHRLPREEAPVLVLDREGSIGSRVFGLLRAYADTHEGEFVVVGVRSSDRASRERENYDRVRDELFANLHDWIVKSGGAIPEDTRLERELHAAEWIDQANGRRKATPKSELRKALGRSPDRADAVALSVWETADTRADSGDSPQETATEPDRYPRLDPYAGMETWRR